MENYIYQEYETERERIRDVMKRTDVKSPEYLELFKKLRSIQDLITAQKLVEREDGKLKNDELRLKIEEKKLELEVEKWKDSNQIDREKIRLEDRRLDIEDRKLDIEAHKIELERRRPINWIDLLKVAVFGGVALAALRYESGGNVFGLDTTKNIMKLNRI